jgi:hypothetical protein
MRLLVKIQEYTKNSVAVPAFFSFGAWTLTDPNEDRKATQCAAVGCHYSVQKQPAAYPYSDSDISSSHSSIQFL